MAPAGVLEAVVGLYSPRDVEAVLGMAAAALASKNAALDELTERLASLGSAQVGRTHAAEVRGEGQQPAGVQATAADSTEQPNFASVHLRLASAERLLTAERSQRLAAKAQLETVKRELADAVAVQSHATQELGELEALIQELRSENQQLRATLTQRESAYLTLLETVQQLVVEHSPVGSGGGSPAKARAPLTEEQGEDGGAGLQRKLWEWQQRLERAAHLQSAERAGQQCSPGSSAAVVAGGLGSIGGFGSSQLAVPEGPASSNGSYASASPQASGLQAAIEAAADSSVCTDDAVSASSSPSAATVATAYSGASEWVAAGDAAAAATEVDVSRISGSSANGHPRSPRILAARSGAGGEAAATEAPPAAASAVALGEAAGVASTPRSKASISGSRIKALGLAAALSPFHRARSNAGREAQ